MSKKTFLEESNHTAEDKSIPNTVENSANTAGTGPKTITVDNPAGGPTRPTVIAS